MDAFSPQTHEGAVHSGALSLTLRTQHVLPGDTSRTLVHIPTCTWLDNRELARGDSAERPHRSRAHSASASDKGGSKGHVRSIKSSRSFQPDYLWPSISRIGPTSVACRWREQMIYGNGDGRWMSGKLVVTGRFFSIGGHKGGPETARKRQWPDSPPRVSRFESFLPSQSRPVRSVVVRVGARLAGGPLRVAPAGSHNTRRERAR